MSKTTEHLLTSIKKAMDLRPKVKGFPVFAEVLRIAGVKRNLWFLPSCQSVFWTKQGQVVMQGTPLVSGPHDVPAFDQAALIKALRKDQAGEGTFDEFLKSSWAAGVVQYEVDFSARKVTYFGVDGEEYVENYPHVKIPE